jgi:Tc5 transposase DNA-binding domain
MNRSTNDARLELALADLRKQSIPNIKSTAERFEVDRTTLGRRFNRKQQSFKASREDSHQSLSLVQEETLIRFINRLTERSLPPTSQIVKNVAEELCGKPIGKNWVGRFTKRYSNRLHAGYIQTLDSKRAKAEYIPIFQKFYDQVVLFLLLYLIYFISY